MTRDDLLKRVAAEPDVCGGMPCVRGTRIPAAAVLDALAEGLSLGAVPGHYPSLRPEDIRAAVAYGR